MQVKAISSEVAFPVSQGSRAKVLRLRLPTGSRTFWGMEQAGEVGDKMMGAKQFIREPGL